MRKAVLGLALLSAGLLWVVDRLASFINEQQQTLEDQDMELREAHASLNDMGLPTEDEHGSLDVMDRITILSDSVVRRAKAQQIALGVAMMHCPTCNKKTDEACARCAALSMIWETIDSGHMGDDNSPMVMFPFAPVNAA